MLRHAPRQRHDLARGLGGDDSSLAAQQVVHQRWRRVLEPALGQTREHAEEHHGEEVVDQGRAPLVEQLAFEPVVERQRALGRPSADVFVAERSDGPLHARPERRHFALELARLPRHAESHARETQEVPQPTPGARRSGRIGQRLAHAHHSFHEGAVEPEAGEQRERAIPIEEVVVHAPPHQAEHVREHVAMRVEGVARSAHQAAELTVDALVDLAREREGERRRDPAVALDDVAVVPDVPQAIRIRDVAQCCDWPRLQQVEPVVDKGPLDILRLSEDCRGLAGKRGHRQRLLVAEHRLITQLLR